jgi:O-antigen ligase
MRREPLFRANRLGTPMLAIVILAALSIVRGAAFPTGYTYNALTASLVLFRSAISFAIYFVALSMATGPADRRKLTYAVVIGLALEAACTLVLGRTGRGARAVGSFDQSNDLGAFLAMFIPFTLALVPAMRGAWGRIALFTTAALGTAAVVYSVSRGALLALTVGMLYVGFRTSKALTALVLVVLATSPLWAPDYLKQRLAGTQVEVQGTDQKVIEAGAQVRVDTWRAIGTLVRDHPIDGVGFSGLTYVLPEAGQALGVEVKDSSHNTYLRFLAEMGIGGLLLFLWLLARCLGLAFTGARAATLPLDRQAGVGLAGATLAMAISCMFGDRFFSILITGNYWVACAIVEDMIQERRRERLQAAAARAAAPDPRVPVLAPAGARPGGAAR